MSKNLKIIINFVLYFLVGFIIFLYGITHSVVPMVLADTINVGYVTDKTTFLYENNNAAAMVSLPVNTTINQYLYNIVVVQLDNVTITNNYTYMLELYLPEAKFKNINNVYVVGGNNNGTTCQTIGLDNSNNSYPKIYFKCSTNLTHLTIGLNNDSPVTSTESITTSNNFRWSYSYLRYYTEDDDIDLSPIIGNATTNTNNIINNNNDNTDKIINNQNELFGTKCENIWNSTLQVGPYAYSDGLHYNFNTYYSNSTPISVTPGSYYISYTTGADRGDNGALFYNNGQFLGYQMLSTDGVINVPEGANQLNFNFASLDGTYSPTNIMLTRGSISKPYCEYGTYLSKLDETTNSINNLDGTLKDNNIDENGIASAFDSFNDYLDENSTITQLITLPITLYTAILNNLNGTCSPFNLGKLYGEDLILPCINISQYLGNALWSMIDIIISGFAIYAISKKMIKVFNNFSSLKEGDVIDD